MNAWKTAVLLLGVTLAGERLASAQTAASPPAFLDGAIMADRDPTEFFYGSDVGTAGRGALGVPLSERSSIRFEMRLTSHRAALAFLISA